MTSERSPRIFVILGLFRPDPDLYRKQLNSLAQQTHANFSALIVADGPVERGIASIHANLNDPRFKLVINPENVGVQGNFARGMREALKHSDNSNDLFAFCDQDDVWRAGKLEEQANCMSRNRQIALCHSDARVITEAGDVIAASMFGYEKRSKRFEFIDLLNMNSVTGMTCLFRKDVAEAASSFPVANTKQILHDHWVALVACQLGEVKFLPEPLVDYVQHEANKLGAADYRPAKPFENLLFGGKAYYAKCRDQYAWRRAALTALNSKFSGTLSYVSVGKQCLSRFFAGEFRQSAQAFRLLIGKLLS